MSWESIEKFEVIFSLCMNFIEIAIVLWGARKVYRFLEIKEHEERKNESA